MWKQEVLVEIPSFLWKAHDAYFKLMVIGYAEEINNYVALRKYTTFLGPVCGGWRKPKGIY
jgi:hypothetical protein